MRTGVQSSPKPFRFEDGRDELNFAEFPLWFHGTRQPASQQLVFESTVEDGTVGLINRKLTIKGAHGLPTVRDADVLFALLAIGWQRDKFSSELVSFTHKQLLDIIDWDDSGKNYKRIDDALVRWDGLQLKYDGWYDIETRSWSTRPMTCGILSGVKMKSQAGQSSAVRWHPDFHKTLKKTGSTIRVNLNEWKSLSSTTTKQAYRFLGKEFGRCEAINRKRKKPIQPSITIDLHQLACEHIGFSRKETPSKLRKKLNAVFADLESIGFIETSEPELRYKRISRSIWTVTVRKAKGESKVQPSNEQEQQPLLFSAVEELPELVESLVNHGMSQSEAMSWYDNPTVTNELIEEQIELLNFLIDNPDKKMPNNPGGWLYKAIANGGYQLPPDFVPKAQREAEKAAIAKARKDRAAAQTRKQQLEDETRAKEKAAEEEQWAAIMAYLHGLSNEEYDACIEDAINNGKPIMRKKARADFEQGLDGIYIQLVLKDHVSKLMDEAAAK